MLTDYNPLHQRKILPLSQNNTSVSLVFVKYKGNTGIILRQVVDTSYCRTQHGLIAKMIKSTKYYIFFVFSVLHQLVVVEVIPS